VITLAEASSMVQASLSPSDPGKFPDPFITANGARCAQVALKALETL
jgi:hypothetical protein